MKQQKRIVGLMETALEGRTEIVGAALIKERTVIEETGRDKPLLWSREKGPGGQVGGCPSLRACPIIKFSS